MMKSGRFSSKGRTCINQSTQERTKGDTQASFARPPTLLYAFRDDRVRARPHNLKLSSKPRPYKSYFSLAESSRRKISSGSERHQLVSCNVSRLGISAVVTRM